MEQDSRQKAEDRKAEGDQGGGLGLPRVSECQDEQRSGVPEQGQAGGGRTEPDAAVPPSVLAAPEEIEKAVEDQTPAMCPSVLMSSAS